MPLRSTLQPFSAVGLLGLLAGPALAQGAIWTASSGGNFEHFGRRVATIGDLNGDGVDDVVIGATNHGCNGQDSGLVRVVDGTDGSTITEYCGDFAKDEFGLSVAGIGDVNNDGTPDFAAGTPLADPNGSGSGNVKIYSGATLGVLREHNGTTATDALGSWISGVGDVSGDGIDDYAIGIEMHIGVSNIGNGRVEVFNGSTGALLYTVTGDSANDRFGYSVAGGGDLNGDGTPDFVVGIYGDDNNGANSGSVRAFDGSNGAVLWTADGDAARDHLGAAVAMGDLNGDGNAEVIVGAPENDANGTDAGQVKVFNSVGTAILTLSGAAAGDQLGFSVAVLGDINGDTVRDFAGGAPFGNLSGGDDNGYIRVYSGANGAELQNAQGTGNGDRMGDAVAGTNDLNGDFIPDYVGGCQQFPKGNGQGYVRAFDPATAPPPPPPPWPVLPTTFVGVGSGYSDDLESYAGAVPAHFGINELESLSRNPDLDAWCNIGQKAAVTSANSGSFALEMGGTPLGMSVQHEVSNGLVIGLDGSGSGNLVLDFFAYDWGEEGNPDDGIFVSNDGVTWQQVYGNWSMLPAAGAWVQVSQVDLSSTSVNTNGQFYLALCQQDDTEFGIGDGISIDDISVRPAGPTGPTLSLIPDPPVAGQPVTAAVVNNNPGEVVYFAYSLQGGGPTTITVPPCGPQTFDLTNPIRLAGQAAANVSGIATLSAPVPPFASGFNLWAQAFSQSQCLPTNSIATQIQ